MAESKKYYWLKLSSDFFEDDTIQFIEEQENGVLYSNFYLKLCLKSLKNDGKLMRLVGDTFIPYDAKSLSKLTGVDIDTVRIAMDLFKRIGLIEIYESGEIYLNQVKEMIGSETDKAKIMRRKRAEQKLIGNNVTEVLPKCYTEIEKDKELEIEIDKEKKETYVSIIDAYTQDDELKASLSDFVEMRKKMKGFTTRALTLALNKLDELALDDFTKVDIVNQSVMNSWKSFYPIHSNKKQKEEMPF